MIIDRLAAAFTRPRGLGETTPVDPWRRLNFLPVPMPEGMDLSMDATLQLSVVWACIDAITKAIASCHWHVFDLVDGQRVYRPNDSLDYILNTRPNADMTAIGWREAMLYAGLTWGNAFSEIVRDGAGRVVELWPLVPDRVNVRREETYPYTLFYEYVQPSGSSIRLDARKVFHLRGPSLDGLMGENIIARAAKAIALSMAAERFSLSYFANGTVVGGVLEFPRTMDKGTYDRLKKDWDEKRSGPAHAHKPIILEGGAKFTSIANDPAASQLVESRKFQLEEICRWYGVPLHKVQHIDRATFNNIEHLGMEFTRDAVTPWAQRLKQEGDYKLFPTRGPNRQTDIDTARLSQGDFKTRMEAYQIGRRMGVYSANDILKKEGENAIGPEGDVRIVETNMTPLDILEESAEANLEKLRAPPPQPALPPGGSEAGSGDGADDEEDVVPASNSKRLVREAVVALFASSIERYAKRLTNREADLKRHALPPAQVEQHMAAERSRLRPWLVEECSNALDLVEKVAGSSALGEQGIVDAADEVDNGVDPREAAERLVTRFMEDV